MDTFTKEELSEAQRALVSLLGKCEKAQEKLRPGTSQFTLLVNRMKAIRISLSLIGRAMEEEQENWAGPMAAVK